MTLLPPPADALVPAWQWFVATWFGSGLIEPLRAGLALLIAGILVVALSRRHALIVPAIGIAVVIFGIFVSTEIGAASGVKDDRRIVIDEVAAFILGAAFLRGFHWAAVAVFGSVFLLFDRIKPWPFHLLEDLPAGWGVMADDLGLGIALGAAFFVLLAARRKLQHA
jgi:phosphatidylglycerophosphatase A